MNHFSEEYLQALINEHKLVVASLSQLTTKSHTYVGRHGPDIASVYADQLKVKKLELEVKIDVLTEFLNG